MKVLENIKFDKLEKLFLNNNEILDINILEKSNFKELKELYLNNNNISDITILEKLNFEKLETLSLDNNKIKDFNIINKINNKKNIISMNNKEYFSNCNYNNFINGSYFINGIKSEKNIISMNNEENFVDDEWMKAFTLPGQYIKNDMEIENKTNIVFKTTQGTYTNLVIGKEETISELIQKYLKRKGLFDQDTKYIIFLYSGTRINDNDKTTVKQFFGFVNCPIIIVNYCYNFIGAINKSVEFYL